ncbi:MAG: hypothetical protein K0Q94_2475 [Paenibacillus sp.]|nr:hypothetical protein [Paenibacillus sp.]
MMGLQPTTSVPLRSLLFHMTDISLSVRPVGWDSDIQTSDPYTLLIVTNGSGSLHTGDTTVLLKTDKCYLLPPGRSYRAVNGFDSSLRYYQLAFAAVHIAGQRTTETYTGSLFSGRLEMTAYPFSRLIRLAEELYDAKDSDGDIESMNRHIRFQELIRFLLEHNLEFAGPANSTQAVESTIRYMRNNYMHSITVKQLAEMAQVPYYQYTPIFQELTGKKPLDYLTELRINRSKELLVHSDEPLREIAGRVGFADEYYFNRRFRQTTGVTPKQYAKYMKHNTRVRDWTGHEVDIPAQPKRIIYFGETFGDLLALGVDAIGGNISWKNRTFFKDRVRNVQDVGNPINPDKLMELKPDLIIFACSDEKQYTKISKIAPTVTFNSFAPLDQRLLTLGHLLGKRREAEKWLDTYNNKAAVVWQQLRTVIEPGETASVFVFDHGNRLFVMGASGLSSVLYHPHGFQPVDKIRDLLDAGLGFAEITERHLPAYTGDRIFMLLPGNAESKVAMEKLMKSALWRSLPPVRNGRVYYVEAAKWNFGDALTREKLLDALPRLLLANS